MIDLRSDTITKPCKAMRDAMFTAEVGDDVFQEDPTVNRLENMAAKIFNKEAALFCSSGTQTNQIAINVHTSPGGEVICHEESHVYKYEGGGIARNSGASVRLLQGNRGRISFADISKYYNNPLDVHLPLTQLVSIEDTSNRGGGAIYDFKEILKIKEVCNSHSLPLHLDGARVFNALVVNGIDPKTYGDCFESISICLSKGLGAPVGSLLIGNKEFIHSARRVRKVFGGGMRQAGIIAAAGIFALENNIQRLTEDHSNAKLLESCLQQLDFIDSVVPVETNIVVAIMKNENQRDVLINQLKNHQILSIAFGPGMVRFVTHLDISHEDILQCCDVLKNKIKM